MVNEEIKHENDEKLQYAVKEEVDKFLFDKNCTEIQKKKNTQSRKKQEKRATYFKELSALAAFVVILILVPSVTKYYKNKNVNLPNNNPNVNIESSDLNKNPQPLYQNIPSYSESSSNEKEVDNDFEEVKNLFLKQYFIKSPNVNDDYYALKQSPDRFIYRVYVNEFNYSTNKYHITLSRNTDTAQNFFLYDSETGKFYREGSTPEEIKNQNDVFIWVP